MNSLRLSICVVALNEGKYLPNLLQNLRDQLYPHEQTEIVLVDSGSSDSTKEIMESFQREVNGFYNIQVLDNPRRNQASGWNVAIKNATGDVISRIDAHSMLPNDFSVLVMKEIENGEDVVGGIRPCLIENKTKWGTTILSVENSLFGSSVNSSRHSLKKQYVKTMFHASYRREVFEKAGLFNEHLSRTEDNEMHYRIRKAGYKLCYNPRIVSFQYSRNTLKSVLRQKYGNGFWVGITAFLCPGCLSIYHFVPFLFLLSIVMTTCLCCMGVWQPAILLWGLYFSFCLLNTFIAVMKNRFVLPFVMPFLFLLLHIAYGLGSLCGFLSFLFNSKAFRNEEQQ